MARHEPGWGRGANQGSWSPCPVIARRSGQDSRAAWRLAMRQHGVVTRPQLRELGFTDHAIDHRIARGRLRRLHRGVFVLAGREINQLCRWMGAVLLFGGGALLSHQSAAELWGIQPSRSGPIEVTLTTAGRRRAPGLFVHRRSVLSSRDRRARRRIPLKSPTRTLMDLAHRLTAAQLESAVNEADRLDLVDPSRLRRDLEEMRGQTGARTVLRLLDRQVFRMADSELELRFFALVRSARLPLPETRQVVNGFRVDFHRPELGLVARPGAVRARRGHPDPRGGDPQTRCPPGRRLALLVCAGATRSPTPIRDCCGFGSGWPSRRRSSRSLDTTWRRPTRCWRSG